ncbi:MAG: aspartate/glutamate racemase family protein [Rhodobacter sp.]|nr:aspartate/glutamate racemase family protein [Rhodobacter sp.]
MERALIVINPNSSDTVTNGIDAAVDPLRTLGVPIHCATLAEGPPAIESQRQADLTVAPMLALAERLEPQALGYVIACFGDPGLHALRDQTGLPVVGIQEAAVAAALQLGQRFGIVSILPASIPRHMRSLGAMGVLNRLAGDRALGLGVAQLSDARTTKQAMIDTGKVLRELDGADVLIMGCAGMAAYRAALEDATGLPVVDPCQAAAAQAIGQITLSLSHRPKEAAHA